jgi:hypothetical protein
MTNKLLVISKALEILPTEIKSLIIKEVKKTDGIFISNTLRKIYYFKVAKNVYIFNMLCLKTTYFHRFSNQDIAIFLLYTKNNITFSYIMDAILWFDRFLVIYNYYRDKSTLIEKYCAYILEKIVEHFPIKD